MAANAFDAAWLYAHDATFYDAWGPRMDVAGLARWSAPELARLRDANHAAIAPGEGLIPDQLVQLFDAQKRDGARRKCVDLYGEEDERDALLRQMGLRRESDESATVMIAWEKARAVWPRFPTRGDRAAPEVQEIRDRDWFDAVSGVRRGALEPWEGDVIRHQATIACARFYGMRIGETYVSCIARYDLPEASRFDSLFVDPDFRRTGFGRSTLAMTLSSAPTDVVYALFDERNVGMATVGEQLGGALVQRDVVRRYVGKWGEEEE